MDFILISWRCQNEDDKHSFASLQRECFCLGHISVSSLRSNRKHSSSSYHTNHKCAAHFYSMLVKYKSILKILNCLWPSQDGSSSASTEFLDRVSNIKLHMLEYNCVVKHSPDSTWLQPSVLHHCPGSALRRSDWPALLRWTRHMSSRSPNWPKLQYTKPKTPE